MPITNISLCCPSRERRNTPFRSPVSKDGYRVDAYFTLRELEDERMALMCREFGISRRTAYKIFNRYKNCGIDGLTDRGRRPLSCVSFLTAFARLVCAQYSNRCEQYILPFIAVVDERRT